MQTPSTDWYRNNWSLGIKKHSWVEKTAAQVDFIIKVLGLTGGERILDLACGYGRHSLELAQRGYSVVGVDITQSYIDDAIATAAEMKLSTRFIRSDIRDIAFKEEFDVVLNLADGAIGYLEDDAENLKIFNVIARALKHGGKSLIDICSQEHAIMHFPRKNWEIGKNAISLPMFEYLPSTKRMLYGGFDIPFGEVAQPPASIEAHSSTRLYSYEEITRIFSELDMETLVGYGDYSLDVPLHHKNIQMVIISVKH